MFRFLTPLRYARQHLHPPAVLSLRSQPLAARHNSSFTGLGVSPSVAARVLQVTGALKPTEIQSLTLPKVLNRKSVVAISETGSGKTMCFAIPIAQQISNQSKSGVTALVLTTSAALVHQTASVLASLLPDQPQEEAVVFEAPLKHQAWRLHPWISTGVAGVGITGSSKSRVLIATPGCLESFDLSTLLEDVSTVAIDECDMALEGGCFKSTRAVLNALNRQVDVQYILCGATLANNATKSVANKIKDQLPFAEFVYSQAHHKARIEIQQRFIRTDGDDDKIKLLLALLQQTPPAKGELYLVFVSLTSRVGPVHEALVQANLPGVVMLHSEMASADRDLVLHQLRDGTAQICVCTDLLSRGIDLRNVGHVIQFDMAKTAVDHLHRNGRTARAGDRGIMTAFVTKGDEILTRAIERAASSSKIDYAFSRNRGFRRRFRRGEYPELEKAI